MKGKFSRIMDDRKLIRTIERKPEKGIAIALELYGDAVKTICRELLPGGTAEDVEEAIAETFIRLWRYGKGFKAGRGTSLKSYIYGIARNAALDKRSQLRRAAGSEEAAKSVVAETAPEIEGIIIKKEEELAVRQVVAEMDEPDKSIFAMRYFHECKVKEIAMKLGLSEKQVENRLFRAKGTLKKKLEERGIRK